MPIKKLLGIVVLGFFFTNFSIAIELTCISHDDESNKFKVYKKSKNTWCMKNLLGDDVCLNNPEDGSTLMLLASILPGKFNKEGYEPLNQDQFEWHEYVFINRFNGEYERSIITKSNKLAEQVSKSKGICSQNKKIF